MAFMINGCFDKPKGKVRVAADRDDVVIYVDGEQKASASKEYTDMLLEEGEHELKVIKPIDNDWQYEGVKSVVIGADTSQKVTIKMKKQRTAKGLQKFLSQYERYDNVVVSKESSLMWQDNSDVANVKKPWLTEEKFWDSSEYFDTAGDTASTYCENLVLGAYSDWRLPKFNELKSILGKNIINSINGVFHYQASSWYWSFDTSSVYTDSAKMISSDGVETTDSKSTSHYVRCVRDNAKF